MAAPAFSGIEGPDFGDGFLYRPSRARKSASPDAGGLEHPPEANSPLIRCSYNSRKMLNRPEVNRRYRHAPRSHRVPLHKA
jgi:hypothetical protein